MFIFKNRPCDCLRQWCRTNRIIKWNNELKEERSKWEKNKLYALSCLGIKKKNTHMHIQTHTRGSFKKFKALFRIGLEKQDSFAFFLK